ncbi:MAG TPA: dTDP-glucose 4,6-dehydratase [Abditibacteriaceae bacterium]|jgi:dTDP-glucose 4,6-dehydratase
MKICVTGGAGFIGSHFVHLIARERPDWKIVVLDKLTYAGRRDNVPESVEFVHGDICHLADAARAVEGCDIVFNFAAESHVDRSLLTAGDFVQTDVYGVFVLLEAARTTGARFVQVSTDEVYGDIENGRSVETDPLAPRSPYSSTKAGGELLARSYFVSHGVPVIITRGSNTFGPRQYPEKLMPLFITNAMQDLPLPMYGDGLQRRDWLFAEDHARGILCAAENGEAGEAYNIGGGNERTNRDVTYAILNALGKDESLIRHVADRPGHDRRYALDCTKLHALGWTPHHSFDESVEQTVAWYQQNEAWWHAIRDDDEYQTFYTTNYAARLK